MNWKDILQFYATWLVALCAMGGFIKLLVGHP